MSVNLELANFEKDIAQLPSKPIMLNDLFSSNVEDEVEVRARVDKMLLSTYTSEDTLPTRPSCECEYLNDARDRGRICPECGSKCQYVTEKDLSPVCWLSVPARITAFINPAVWRILSNALTFESKNKGRQGGIKLLEYLTNPYYEPLNENKQFKTLKGLKIPRSLNYFVENFDEIMGMLIREKIPYSTNAQRRVLEALLTKYRDCIFTRYLPLPNKIAFVIEATSTGTYASRDMTPARDAIRTMEKLYTDPDMSLKRMEERIVRVQNLMAAYYKNIYGKQYLSSKQGWFRKHVYGCKPPFTARGVIVSRTNVHNYDELVFPWSLSVSVLSLHITSKLLKRVNPETECRYTVSEAENLINGSYNVFNQTIYDIMMELIREHPEQGIPCLFGRNPTLQRASIQCFFIRQIKKDPTDFTVGLSVLAIRGPNADQI